MCAWSAGTFTRSNGSTGWANDAAASIGIEAGRHDTVDNDLANGINNCLTKDGQNAATANLPMGGFIHTNVGEASGYSNYSSAGQIIKGGLIYLGTSGGAANVQTLTPSVAITSYVAGQVFRFLAGLTNTSGTTINISALGAKTIKRQNGRALIGNEIISGYFYEIFYNGTDFILINPSSEWQNWTPAVFGFSSNPVSVVYRYKVSPDGNRCTLYVDQADRGTSNATNFLISAPITSRATGTSAIYRAMAAVFDNGVGLTTPGLALLPQASATISLNKDCGGGAFTAANGKSASFILEYEI